MKVFISWSGKRSKIIALTLRQWLPDVIQSVEPWMSEFDIDAGARWSGEIEKELSEAKFGIICLTRDNFNAPWILFEAGALAKTLSDTFVCPYLIDLDTTDLPQGPLTQFQAKRANQKDTWDVVSTINKALEEKALPNERLERTFTRVWPELESALKDLPKDDMKTKKVRSVENMVAEILDIVRDISRRSPLISLGTESRATTLLDKILAFSPQDVEQYRKIEHNQLLAAILRNMEEKDKSITKESTLGSSLLGSTKERTEVNIRSEKDKCEK
jgi:hypothetical protein